MSVYKLTYFNLTWLAEPIRFLLKYKGINFEDIRHDYQNFAPFKKNYPTQHLPVLEIDGTVLHQSNAIGRYLANEFDLSGTTNIERAQVDMVVDTIVDLRKCLDEIYCETDLEKRQEKVNNLLAGKAGIYLNYLNTMVKENDGYFVGGKLTWADLFFSATWDVLLKYYGTNAFDNYPELQKLNDTVRKIPNIKAWVETRPKTED